jgi:hypothetical protein
MIHNAWSSGACRSVIMLGSATFMIVPSFTLQLLNRLAHTVEGEMRVLIAARKSNKVASKTGDGIGLDTQDTLAREFAERNGYEVGGVAGDTISGTVEPMHRRELGQWLSDPVKLSSYDAIVFYAVDRISRGADEDFSNIESWASQNGVSPRWSAVGSAMAILLFLGTLSFLFTTPGVTAAGGFPVLSVLPGQFLLKDLVLLGASLWTLGDSLAAIKSRTQSAVPRRDEPSR